MPTQGLDPMQAVVNETGVHPPISLDMITPHHDDPGQDVTPDPTRRAEEVDKPTPARRSPAGRKIRG